MMQYLVVSDNHGDQEILKTLLKAYGPHLDAFIHCGDSELQFDDPIVQRMTIVRGNMDFDNRFPLDAVVKNTQDKIYVAHGHRYDVGFGLSQFFLAAREHNANMAFYGHTHQLYCTMENHILLLNPGSISQPRGKYADIGGTFALINADAKNIVVDYYNRQLQPIKKLHFEFKR